MYTEKNEAVYTGKERVFARILLTKEEKKVSPKLGLSDRTCIQGRRNYSGEYIAI